MGEEVGGEEVGGRRGTVVDVLTAVVEGASCACAYSVVCFSSLHDAFNILSFYRTAEDEQTEQRLHEQADTTVYILSRQNN